MTPHPEILRPPEADSRMTFEARLFLKEGEGGNLVREGGFAPLSKNSSPSPNIHIHTLYRMILFGEGDKGGEVHQNPSK